MKAKSARNYSCALFVSPNRSGRRRERDSNPRGCYPHRFRIEPVWPLRHPSARLSIICEPLYFARIGASSGERWNDNAERRTQNAKRRTQNAERRTQNAERRTQNAERKTQNAERRTQNAERRTQNERGKRKEERVGVGHGNSISARFAHDTIPKHLNCLAGRNRQVIIVLYSYPRCHIRPALTRDLAIRPWSIFPCIIPLSRQITSV